MAALAVNNVNSRLVLPLKNFEYLLSAHGPGQNWVEYVFRIPIGDLVQAGQLESRPTGERLGQPGFQGTIRPHIIVFCSTQF